MDKLHDPFEILGIPSDADDRALKKAYRRLVKRWHPDLNPGRPEAAMHFKQIQQAYETICGRRHEKTAGPADEGQHVGHYAPEDMQPFSSFYWALKAYLSRPSDPTKR